MFGRNFTAAYYEQIQYLIQLAGYEIISGFRSLHKII